MHMISSGWWAVVSGYKFLTFRLHLWQTSSEVAASTVASEVLYLRPWPTISEDTIYEYRRLYWPVNVTSYGYKKMSQTELNEPLEVGHVATSY